MDLRAALAYLDSHLNREATAGRISGLSLGPVERLLEAMGDPHRAYPVIHVTGTNGKGSVSALVSALLEAHGLTVGLYTSPHLERVNERIARNREPIADDEFARAVQSVAAVEQVSGVVPSYFEILTAAALGWFAEVAVDVAVVEVGLLGQFDATNVVDSQVSVITNVGKDHTDGREGWRHAVASEKAGIIKPGSIAVVGASGADLLHHFLSRRALAHWVAGQDFDLEFNELAVGGRLISVRAKHGRYRDLYLPLHGAHQARNAALAVVAVEAFFDRELDSEVVASALAGTELPGRFEIIGRNPLVVLDGAHNPPGAKALAETIDDVSIGGRRIWVLGMLTGREPVELVVGLGITSGDLVIACAPDSARATDPAEIARIAEARGADVEVAARVPDAVERALAVVDDSEAVIICGSLYVVGEARSAWAAREGSASLLRS